VARLELPVRWSLVTRTARIEPAAAFRPLAVAALTTAFVTALSYGVPAEHAASAVGLAFLGVTYLLTLRDPSEDGAARYGLSLGGLFDAAPLDWAKLARSAASELGFALLVSAIVFPPFWVGYRAWWSPVRAFHPAPLSGVAEDALGQFLVIALPEEAFYRGYLQTRLDEAWTSRVRVLGTAVGPGLAVTSLVFALGHVATEFHPSRLAVFFPSLLFGWMRARRGGVGAGAAFHAFCNLFASYLARSYGLAV
jgi:membrane protease YdiL (CAAX protease family)